MLPEVFAEMQRQATPAHSVREELRSGQLARLVLESDMSMFTLYLIWQKDLCYQKNIVSLRTVLLYALPLVSSFQGPNFRGAHSKPLPSICLDVEPYLPHPQVHVAPTRLVSQRTSPMSMIYCNYLNGRKLLWAFVTLVSTCMLSGEGEVWNITSLLPFLSISL